MKHSKDKVLQKIGRNVVNLQRIEGMLKSILINNNFQCPINKFAETLEKRKKDFSQKTLGQLTNEYIKTFDANMEYLHEYPEDRDEAWVSFSFSLENEEGKLPEQEKALKFLVTERNRLIHHMLLEFNPESKDSCDLLISELDNQNEMIQREYKNIQLFGRSLIKAREQLLKDRLKDKI
jgi:hypothetical protein